MLWLYEGASDSIESGLHRFVNRHGSSTMAEWQSGSILETESVPRSSSEQLRIFELVLELPIVSLTGSTSNKYLPSYYWMQDRMIMACKEAPFMPVT